MIADDPNEPAKEFGADEAHDLLTKARLAFNEAGMGPMAPVYAAWDLYERGLRDGRSAAVAEVVGPLREWLERQLKAATRACEEVNASAPQAGLWMYSHALRDVLRKLDELTKGGK